ncbi:MAG: purine-nucleoside phosphorylase [delta proteobacterium ML8_D]|jgi:purine-nucleoside phosphorylase|nr:MAG: purine-nucleoside phosphorylase [delta proteobacterium ML8_D]
MEKYAAAVDETVNFFQRDLPWVPDICLMLGTGLGGMASAMDVAWNKLYEDIPNFPLSTSPDHAGRLLAGRIGNAKVVLFQGRFHFYEGYSTRELTFPVRVMAGLGTKLLIGCNAAGGLNLDFSSGDLMLITDHINLIPENPLRGPNMEKWGPRFPDLSRAYSIDLRKKVVQTARELGMPLREGVFVAVPGPSLETPAETRFLRLIGADAVAMSLVPEVIVAVYSGMEVLGISVIANVNDPGNFQPILIEEVIAQAHNAEHRLERLLVAFLKEHFK